MSGPTGIVIPCHVNPLHTALCPESIARRTPEPHGVTVIDDGGTDATAEWSAARSPRDPRGVPPARGWDPARDRLPLAA